MPSKEHELTEEEFLAQYDASQYPKPSVTVDTVIFRKIGAQLQVLLVKRGNHPCRGLWALPGGFLNMEENLDEAAARELAEETSVSTDLLEEFGVYGAVGRDKRDRVITIAYAALLEDEVQEKAGDDAAECAWFDLRTHFAADRLKIELKGASEMLQAEVSLQISALSGRVRSKEIITSDLAFDHALILADGYLHVRKEVEEDA